MVKTMVSHNCPAQGSEPTKILIAEDHLDSRDALQLLLEAANYLVLVASDGEEALNLAVGTRPDLILMDIMMPEIDGLEAIRRLRDIQTTQRIPIIAVTAMEGGRRLALEAGANDYLPKPIDTRVLLRKIEDLLQPS